MASTMTSSYGLPFTTTSQMAYRLDFQQRQVKLSQRPKTANAALSRSTSFRFKGRSQPLTYPIASADGELSTSSSFSSIETPNLYSIPFSSSSTSNLAAGLPFGSTTHSRTVSSPVLNGKLNRTKSRKQPSHTHSQDVEKREELPSESKERRSLWKLSQRWRRPSTSASSRCTLKDEDWDHESLRHQRSGSTPAIASSPSPSPSVPLLPSKGSLLVLAALYKATPSVTPSPPPKEDKRRYALAIEDGFHLGAMRKALPIKTSSQRERPILRSIRIDKSPPILQSKTSNEGSDVEEFEEMTPLSRSYDDYEGNDEYRLHETYNWLGQDPSCSPELNLDLQSLASSGWTLEGQEFLF